jgi:hypothetical protein
MHCIRRYDLKIVFALDRVICGQAIYNVNYGRFCCIRVYIVSYSLDGLQLDVDVLAEEVKKEEQEGGWRYFNNKCLCEYQISVFEIVTLFNSRATAKLSSMYSKSGIYHSCNKPDKLFNFMLY